MTVTLRTTKGSLLTVAEVDANFTHVANLAAAIKPFTDYGASTGATAAANSAAITSAEASAPFYVPPGTFTTNTAQGSFVGRWWGDGTIIDSSGNKRGRMFSAIAAAPSSLGDHGSVLTAFNGDTSKVQMLVEHRITGALTLGNPTGTQYVNTPEAYPHYTYLYVGSDAGKNDSTSGNGGRTQACAYHVKVFHAGQGDATAFNATCIVTNSRSGATNYLANPGAVLFNGSVFAAANGAALGPQEFVINDQGYDAAGGGSIMSMYRSVDTRALGEFWCGFRSQSKGAKNVDHALGVFGPHLHGLDTTIGTLTGGVVAMKADQKILGNASSTNGWDYGDVTGDDYITFASSVDGWVLSVNGVNTLQVLSTQLTVTQHIALSSGKELRNGGTKVVGARDTGWTAMTGTTNKATSYDTSTVTLAQLAGRVMAIQAALTTHGLIGA
jgi:hypothetical protein